MTLVLLVVAAVAGLNPARTRLALPEDEQGRARPAPLAIGAVLTFVAAAAAAAAATSLLDWLDVSPETFRIAAGLVLAVAGLFVLVRPRPPAEPELAGKAAGLVPVAFPLLISPELAMVAIAGGSDAGVGDTVVAVAVGLTAVAMFALLPHRPPPAERLLLWGARMLAAALVVAAVALGVDGVADV